MILPKDRDPRFITIRRGGTLTDADHQLLALWAATCAEHVLPLFESAQPAKMSARRTHAHYTRPLLAPGPRQLTGHRIVIHRPVLEGWTTLTYLAALHPTLHWGHMVLIARGRRLVLPSWGDDGTPVQQLQSRVHRRETRRTV